MSQIYRYAATYLLAGVAILSSAHASAVEDSLREFLSASDRIPSPFIEIRGSISQKAKSERSGRLESAVIGTDFRAVFQPFKAAPFWISCSPLVTRRKVQGDPALFGAREIEYTYNGEWGAMKLYSEWGLPAEGSGTPGDDSKVNQAFIYGEPPAVNWIAKMFLGERVLLSRQRVFDWTSLSDALVVNRIQYNVQAETMNDKEVITITFSPNGSAGAIQALTYDPTSFALLKIVTAFRQADGKTENSREEWTFSNFHPVVSGLPPFPQWISYNRFEQNSIEEEIVATITEVKTDVTPSESVFSAEFEKGFFVTDTRTGVSFSASASPSATIDEISNQVRALGTSSPK
jgi:hypothetical protein